MRSRHYLQLLSLLLAPWLCAAASGGERTPAELTDLETTADYAFYSEDVHLLARLVDGAATLADSDSMLAQYQYAHAAFRQLQRAVLGHDGKTAGRAGELCVRALDRLLERAPRDAEASALRAACNAYLALGGGMRGQLLALRVSEDLQMASTQAPRNPRVLLTRGLARWYRRDATAVDRAAARADFEAAARLFELPTTSNGGEPTWGAAEAWLYAGLAAAADGELLAARNCYEKSLLVAPDFAAARRALTALAATP